MKKQSCRMTPLEKEKHNEAVKLRKMTDEQLVGKFRELQEQVKSAERDVCACKEQLKGAEAAVAAIREQTGENIDQGNKTAGTGARESVIAYLNILLSKAGTGNGIGRGTIFKLRKILDSLTDAELSGSSEA